MEDRSAALPPNRRQRLQDLSLTFSPPQLQPTPDFSCNFTHLQTGLNLNQSIYVQGSSDIHVATNPRMTPDDDVWKDMSTQPTDFLMNHQHLGMEVDPTVQMNQWMQMRSSTSFHFPVQNGLMKPAVNGGHDHGEVSEKQCRNYNYTPKEDNYAVDEDVERRQMRMMKNRESAARSRARKQAYTNQLEQQVMRLRKSISWLKKQKEIRQLLFSSPKAAGSRYQLRRTSSAKF